MYCTKCGTHNEDTARFCMKCGTQLTPVPPDRPAGAGLSEARRTVIWMAALGGLAVLLLVLVIGGGVWIYGRIASDDDKGREPVEGAAFALTPTVGEGEPTVAPLSTPTPIPSLPPPTPASATPLSTPATASTSLTITPISTLYFIGDSVPLDNKLLTIYDATLQETAKDQFGRELSKPGYRYVVLNVGLAKTSGPVAGCQGNAYLLLYDVDGDSYTCISEFSCSDQEIPPGYEVRRNKACEVPVTASDNLKDFWVQPSWKPVEKPRIRLVKRDAPPNLIPLEPEREKHISAGESFTIACENAPAYGGEHYEATAVLKDFRWMDGDSPENQRRFQIDFEVINQGKYDLYDSNVLWRMTVLDKSGRPPIHQQVGIGGSYDFGFGSMRGLYPGGTDRITYEFLTYSDQESIPILMYPASGGQFTVLASCKFNNGDYLIIDAQSTK